MKRNLVLIILAVFILFLAGCVPSIHPLYHEEDLVFKYQILGAWQNDDNENLWEFKKSGDKAYKLIFYEEGTNSEFIVHLVKLGDHYFFDFYPGGNEHLKISSLLSVHLLPVHTFAKVEFENNKILIYFFDNDWLDKLLKQRKIKIAHEETQDYNVLTASTDELQKFVTKYAGDTDAFISPIVLIKNAENRE